MEGNVLDWFRAFYDISDDERAHERYAALFTSDATLIMGDKVAIGQTDILKLRKSMWLEVSSRKHTFNCYSSSERPSTYLLEGEVLYEFKVGGTKRVKWVAKADFEGEGIGRRLRFYQVFLNVGQ